MKETTSMNTDTVSLVDIRDVSVDKNLTREERVAEFVRQIKNPYCFRCGRLPSGHSLQKTVLRWRTV